jgi:PTS system mannose-specific IIC component
VFGLATNELGLCLSVALFFELLWLDLLPAGTFIPPQLVAATVACLSLVSRFGLAEPPLILVAILASLPLAWLGSTLEYGLRGLRNKSYNRLLNWARTLDPADRPGVLAARSLAVTFSANLTVFFVVLFALHLLVGFVLELGREQLLGLPLTWTQLWLAASIGGLLALRIKRAYGFLALGALLVIFFTGSGRF